MGSLLQIFEDALTALVISRQHQYTLGKKGKSINMNISESARTGAQNKLCLTSTVVLIVLYST